MPPEDPAGHSLDKDMTEQENRRARGDTGAGDGAFNGAVDGVDAASSGCGSCDVPGCDTPGCDTPGCDLCDGCDLLLFLRLSTLLLLVSRVVPEAGGASAVRALLRFYRRRLTRFTPICPSTPSCSAYATAAVDSLGVRRGLVATAHRLRACGQRSSRRTTRST